MKLSKIALCFGALMMSGTTFAAYSCEELKLVDCPN